MIKTIAITSGKGGVGKTNIVANLAIALSRKGKRVLVLDADLGLCNIDVLLGLAPRYNIQHLLKGEKTLKEIILEGPEGIKIVPASSGVEELTHLDEFKKLRLIDEFQALQDEIDYLLIDTGAGISPNVTFFCIASQETLIVLTPEPTSLTDAYAMIKVLNTRYQEKEFRVLINQVKSSAEALEIFRRLHMVTDRYLNVSLDYMGFIPFDRALQRAVKSQRAVVIQSPHSQVSEAFSALADRIKGLNSSSPKGGIQFFFDNLFEVSDGVRV
ncbi:MAG: MinD/ParA family protein [Nitrospirae bacterium]|nr:MAG: MinD/ParA family protein [Nitrospirota bacterium]